MNTIRHACMIDRHITTVVALDHETPGKPRITACKSVPAGTIALSGPDYRRSLKKIVHLLRKLHVQTTTVCLRPPRWYPLESVFNCRLDRNSVIAQCRFEATMLLDEPGNFRCDLVEFYREPPDSETAKKLVVFYTEELPSRLLAELAPRTIVEDCSLYLRPLVCLSSHTKEKITLVECEPEYVVVLESCGGKLQYFRYWPLDNPADTIYFILRELCRNSEDNLEPVYLTGTNCMDRQFTETLRASVHRELRILDPVALLSLEADISPEPLRHPSAGTAISAALMASYD